jgi:hypothetical protein
MSNDKFIIVAGNGAVDRYRRDRRIKTDNQELVSLNNCECGAEKEMVHHYLLNCELYDEERDELRRSVAGYAKIEKIIVDI